MSDRPASEIASEIEATRERLGEDLNELQHRLDPNQLRFRAEASIDETRRALLATGRQLGASLEDGIERAGRGAVARLRDHSAPVALLGAGIGWLLLLAQRSRGEENALLEPAADRPGVVLDDHGEVVYHARPAPQAGVPQAGAPQAGAPRGGLPGFAHEQPLVAGVATLAAGLAVGMMLPRTRSEDRLMGEASNEVVGGVRATARGASRVATRAAETFGAVAREQFRERGLAADEVEAGLRATLDATGEAAREEARRQGLADPSRADAERTS